MCDGAKRGLGCEIARWRYDEFEASFLAFVKELNLSQIVGTEDQSKSKSLDDAIAALSGELGDVEGQRDKTYELFEKAGSAVDYVGRKLNELQERRAKIERSLEQKRAERLALDADQRALRRTQDDVKVMLDSLKRTKGDDLYKLRRRSRIGSAPSVRSF